jgi:hypothetical protein
MHVGIVASILWTLLWSSHIFGYAFSNSITPIHSHHPSASSWNQQHNDVRAATRLDLSRIGVEKLTYDKVSSQAIIPLPKNRNSVIGKLLFNWVKPLMEMGNSKVIQVADLWLLDPQDMMKNASETFELSFQKELLSVNVSSSFAAGSRYGTLGEYWRSPISRAVVKMYMKPFVNSGLLKLFNTLVQFLPSILISRILRSIDQKKSAATAAAGWAATRNGATLSVLLFIALTAKTAIENRYFYSVINLGANIRGTLSAAIYRKSLRLSPSGRQNTTAGEIINYMQLDTNRLEQVAGSIHTVWDGLLQIIGYTALLLHFLGPSVLAGIAGMLVIIPLNAILLKMYVDRVV